MDLSDLRFDEGHAWVRDEGKELIIGISEYAQEQLGDVIFVELPEPGTKIVRDDPFGTPSRPRASRTSSPRVNAHCHAALTMTPG